MIAYTYNPYTFEFVGTSIADPDQKQNGVYLLPAASTWIACPEYNRETHVGYFDIIKQEWKIQDIDSEPEIETITEEQVNKLKEELEEVSAMRSKVLEKLGLTQLEIELLLVKLPTNQQLEEMIGQAVPDNGVPSLKHPDM
jgi:hypothetical protein